MAVAFWTEAEAYGRKSRTNADNNKVRKIRIRT